MNPLVLVLNVYLFQVIMTVYLFICVYVNSHNTSESINSDNNHSR